MTIRVAPNVAHQAYLVPVGPLVEVRDPTGTVDERSDRHPLSGSDRARQVARRVLIAGIGDGEFGEKGARVGGGIQRVDAEEGDPAAEPQRRDLEQRKFGPARCAPRCPDVDDHRKTAEVRQAGPEAGRPTAQQFVALGVQRHQRGRGPARAARGVAGVAARLGGWIAPQPAATSANVINPSGTTGRFVNTIQRSNQGVS